MGALKLDVLGGVGNVQLAARFTNGGASASRRTNSSRCCGVVGEGAAAANEAKNVARAMFETVSMIAERVEVTLDG